MIVTAIGLLAQFFFSARSVCQWILSEKAHRVLSPAIFWIFSLCGSILLALYGYLRQDFAVIMGQFASYYIYIWNIRMKKIRLSKWVVGLLCMLPVMAVAGAWTDPTSFINDFFLCSGIPLWLIIFGLGGQLLFTLRFVYQWWYSRRVGQSELPPLFWWISLVGASLIFTYGIFRQDIVLMLGQGFGLLVYGRNLCIGRYQSRSSASQIEVTAKP